LLKLEAFSLVGEVMNVTAVMLQTCQDEVLAIEKVLVEGLRFDLLVELPYSYLLKFIKLLQGYVLFTTKDCSFA